MPEDISIKVRSELFKRKMSQKELANLLGISGPYLSDIINGRRSGSKAQKHVEHIKKILGI